jgi:HAD superfamily hydrolase (TIGR01549 family)
MEPNVRLARPFLLFDVDGTFYEFREGSYARSMLRRTVRERACQFLVARTDVEESNVESIMQHIEEQYGEDVSVAFEERFHITRDEYFRSVWDINPEAFVDPAAGLRDMLSRLHPRYAMVILSDAPRIWIDRVLNFCNVADFFEQHIISGEGDRRKNRGNALEYVVERFKVSPSSCIVIGDQEETDIIPARAFGMRAIRVSAPPVTSCADATIAHITDLEAALEQLTSS